MTNSATSQLAEIKSALDVLRSGIRSAVADLAALDHAAATNAELAQRAKAVVSDLANQALSTMPLDICAAPLGDFSAGAAAQAIHNAGEMATTSVPGADALFYSAPRTGAAGLLALIEPAKFEALLVEQAKKAVTADGMTQMTAAEQATKRATLKTTIHGLEIREEVACREFESLGITIGRRGDAPPALVLAPDEALYTQPH